MVEQKDLLTENSFIRLLRPIMEKHSCAAEQAQEILAGFQLHLICDQEIFKSVSLQAALLTAVNAGKRCFLGGVFVSMTPNVPSLLPWPGTLSLNDIVQSIGGQIQKPSKQKQNFSLLFGNVDTAEDSLRIVCSGWRGGIVPACENPTIDKSVDFASGGILAGALGVAYGFFRISGLHPRAGDKAAGISIWNPKEQWLSKEANGPMLTSLPKRLWVLGLGHLGQAYLWHLGLLPFPKPSGTKILLQDFDRIVQANFYTGLLCEQQEVLGEYKTRVCAQWLEARGIETVISERVFDAKTERTQEEPYVALCGFDSFEARALLEGAKFDLVVECGLGSGSDQFDRMMLHTFPNAIKPAAQIWSVPQGVDLSDNGKFVQLLKKDVPEEDCGVIALSIAGKAVSSAFVGAFASTLAIGEVLRGLHRGVKVEECLIDIRSLDDDPLCVIKKQYTTEMAKNGSVRI